MPAPDIKIDLFISYSKYDEAWARKLYTSLRKRGIKPTQIFFDKEYLRVGVEWEPTMSEAVTSARVLVCFWSKSAKASNYVLDERSKFNVTMVGEDEKEKVRKLVIVPLEETKEKDETDPYAKYQWADEIMKTDGAYAKGPDALNPNVWNKLVDSVYEEITRKSKSTPITLVVVAMTRDRIDALNFTVALPNADTLANAIKKMGIITDVSLLDRLDPAMDIRGSTLEDTLKALNIAAVPTPTALGEPREIKIVSNGESLAEILKRKNITTVDDLMSSLKQNSEAPLPDGRTLKEVLADKGITLEDLEAFMIKTALRQYYSESALSWRPFGSPDYDILTIMDDVQGQYNSRLVDRNSAELPFRWEVEEDFASGSPKAEAVINKLASERSVIVVDPLSLYEPAIATSFTYLYPSFDNEKALIMAFAPFVLPTPTSVMRELIKHQARRIWKNFFEPEFKTGKVYAQCGPDVGDAADINRWLLHALKPVFGDGQASGKKQAATFLSPGHDAPQPAGGAFR
jgi:hypothetical protein